MQEEMFRAWMNVDRKLAPASAVSSMSRCRRVERHYGNLDTHYDRDRLVGLLDRLRPDRPNHSVPLSGNVRHGTDTLQSAVRLYRDFRDARAGVNLTEGPRTKRRRQEPGFVEFMAGMNLPPVAVATSEHPALCLRTSPFSAHII